MHVALDLAVDLALNLLIVGVPVVILFAALMPYRFVYFAITGALIVAFPFTLSLAVKGATSAAGAAVILYMGLLALCFLITHGISVWTVLARRRKRVAARPPVRSAPACVFHAIPDTVPL